MMEPRPQGCQRASEIIRKQKRKALDARRSKCRIRIGSHLEQWCLLKEELGFSLHSQLAKYLLDRYSSHGSVLKTGSDSPDILPDPLPSDALQHLVALSHHHSQECGFLPNVKPAGRQQESLPNRLVWECLAGHTFSWSPPAPKICPPPVCQAASRGREEEEEEEEEKAVSSKPSPPPSPITRCRRSLRRAAAAHAISLALASNSPCPEEEETEESSREDGEGGADRKRTACMSPGNGAGLGKEAGLPSGNTTEEPAAPPEEIPGSNEPPEPGSTMTPPEEIPVSDLPEEEEEGEGEDFAVDGNGVYTDDLRDENYRPALDSCKKKTQTRDEDMSQIGPKRIRKAAKREILLCDYDGCGKIFSNRQYLNHHKKYQHVHQKMFTCSDPSCGKSFNFKKHLKEHEKLHSDKRDYICEFCARSFRTSSNLIIHRRIHTGEKPLQCEICGFTCRQKASLNWHMKKHDADSFYQFSCDLCGKKFEKKDNVAAHKSKSHPEVSAGPPPPVQEPPAPIPPLGMEQRPDPLRSPLCDPGKRVEPSALAITVILE